MDNISKEIEALELNGDNPSKDMASVCFEIPVHLDLDMKCCRKPPKRISAQEPNERRTLTVENLNKKQQLAEERRKKRKAEKLARIHQRQVAAREMAKSVEILLQQRALWQGNENAGVQKMSSQEIMKTAKQVQLNFYKMKQEVCDNLNVENTISRTGRNMNEMKENRNLPDNRTKAAEEEEMKHNRSSESAKPKGGVAFTIDLDGVGEKEKRKYQPLQNHGRKNLSHDDLLSKQMLAEERRMRRLQLRSQRVRENREAYYQLHSNLAQLMDIQEMTSQHDMGSPEVKAANKEAARLANEIADTFGNLAERYSTDLARSDGFPCIQLNIT